MSDERFERFLKSLLETAIAVTLPGAIVMGLYLMGYAILFGVLPPLKVQIGYGFCVVVWLLSTLAYRRILGIGRHV